VIAGGKKISELEALRMAHDAVRKGAAGVDMGRNIFQSENPIAMIQAVRRVVHENAAADEAFDFYLSLKSGGRK
jgi:putative autoinducer-2 (AI-2) aldolase